MERRFLTGRGDFKDEPATRRIVWASTAIRAAVGGGAVQRAIYSDQAPRRKRAVSAACEA